ncbi:hypothetical protein OXX69_005599 [Metschnikowia pulcherrima]
MKKVIAIVVTVLTSVSCASSEVPGLRAKLYNIPYDFEFRNNPKFHENLSTKFALSTETAALTNIDFDLSHKMDSDVFVEEHSGYFVAPIDGIYEFSLDAQIEARFQIGAGDTCHSDAYNSVSAENTLKSPSSKNLAVDLKKGNAYPMRVAQYLSKDAESGKPFISLSCMNPKGEYVNDISPYIYQAEAGVAPYSSTGTLKTSVRSCGGIELTGQTILRRVFADFDKKYDMVKDAKTSAFVTTGYVRSLEPQAEIYGNIVNSRKFAVEITGFMKVQNSGTYKFEVNLQGAVALQIGQAGQDMANNQPLLALNAKAKPEIKSQKKTLSAEETYPIRIVFINKRAKAQFALKVFYEKEALDFQTIFYTDSFLNLMKSAVEGSENTSETSSLNISRSLDTTGEQESGIEDISGYSMDSHYLSALHDSFEEDSHTSAIGDESLRSNTSTENTISSSPELPREPILESSKGRPKGAKSRKPRSPSRNHDQSRPSQIGAPLPNMLVQPYEEPAILAEPSTNFGDASVIHSSLFPSGVDASVSRFEVPFHVPNVSPLSSEEIGESHVFEPLTSHTIGLLSSSSDVLTRPDEALVSYHDLLSNLDGGSAPLNHSTSLNDSLVVLDDALNILNDSPSKEDDFVMRAAIDSKILETVPPSMESLASKSEEKYRSAEEKLGGNSSLSTSETFEILKEAFPVSDDNNVEPFNNTSISWRSTGSIAFVSKPCVMPLQSSNQALSTGQVQFAPASDISIPMTSSSDCDLKVSKWRAQDHMKVAKGQVATNISIVGARPKSHRPNHSLEEGALSSSGTVRFGSIDGAANFTRIDVASNFSQQLVDTVLRVNKSSEIGERLFSCGTPQRPLNLTRSLELNLCGECEMMCPVENIEAGLSKCSGAWSEKPAQTISHDLLLSAANALVFTSCPDSQESIVPQTATSSKISGSGLPLSSACIENCGALTVGPNAEASISTIGNDLSLSTSLRRGNTDGSVETLPAAVGKIYDAGAVSKGLRKMFLLAAYVTLLW